MANVKENIQYQYQLDCQYSVNIINGTYDILTVISISLSAQQSMSADGHGVSLHAGVMAKLASMSARRSLAYRAGGVARKRSGIKGRN
jgi:hypothetical protein